ncbi:MAG: DUF4390 domain-containing protein [Candidatus Zixiibacteriota bacterium]
MTGNTLIAALALSILLIGGWSQPVRAEDPQPAILSVSLGTDQGYITCDVKSSGLFSERITGTVKSGLPAVVDLFYYFSTREGNTVAENVLSFSLRYDVWDDIYSIEAPDTTRSYSAFSEMQQAIDNLHQLKLVQLDSLDSNRSYRVHMRIMINPLRGTDREKIAGWVSENMRTSEDDSWHGQVLNLNELISHFFSRERGVVNQSGWYKSDFVKPDSLRVPGKEEE